MVVRMFFESRSRSSYESAEKKALPPGRDTVRSRTKAVNTAKPWFLMLLATYQVLGLRSYFANVDKGLIKILKEP
jgi:hypothetical protein